MESRGPIQVSGDMIFPSGGVWYIYVNRAQRPSTGAATGEGDPNGVHCFVSEELAKKFLQRMVPMGLDLNDFDVRYVKAEELHAWITRAKEWASYLLWYASDDEAETYKIHAISIDRLLDPKNWRLREDGE